MNMSIETMAETLWQAYGNRAVAPLRHETEAISMEVAYQIQNVNTQRRLRNGSKLIGRKIGLTSKAVQQQLGVDQPDYGMLFSDSIHCSGEQLFIQRFLQPKIEAEIAFVLKKDLHGANLTIADVIGAVDYAVAALEIVDSRIQNWDISLFDTIADNASYGALVMGTQPVPLSYLDLENCEMELLENGNAVSAGRGSACLGNPLNATSWLANVMVAAGCPLSAGDIVLSGALGPMQTMTADKSYRATITGLGSVSIATGGEQ